jgi:chitin synthase
MLTSFDTATGNTPQANLRRSKSLLGRDGGVGEPGLFRRTGSTLRRKHVPSAQGGPTPNMDESPDKPKHRCFDDIGPGPKDAWFIVNDNRNLTICES